VQKALQDIVRELKFPEQTVKGLKLKIETIQAMS
jgi:hypothetical protein